MSRFLIFFFMWFLIDLFFFHFNFLLNETMYEHFLKVCIFLYMHLSLNFSDFLFEVWLLSLSLLLLNCSSWSNCSFWSLWLNDSALVDWFWVTSCKIAALTKRNDENDWFFLLTTILYALVILKKSTNFSTASSWFFHVSQNVEALLCSARKSSLTKMTSFSNVFVKFRLIICNRGFSHSAICVSILSFADKVFKSRHCSWIC